MRLENAIRRVCGRYTVAFAVLLTGCANVQTGPQLRSYVRVKNDHWLEQVVYAHCGARIRIGVAAGIRETLLRVPRECEDRNVAFSTDPIGSHDRSLSDPLMISAGNVVILQVPAFFNGYLFLSR